MANLKAKKILKISAATILFLGIAAYIVYAIAVASKPQPEDTCTELILNIQENTFEGFITPHSVENELNELRLNPKGKEISKISTGQIETALKKNEFIESVECYKTANNKVAIDITQRTPVIYVLPNGIKGYYVDIYGKVLPNRHYPANLPVATGAISQNYATTQLAKLGKFIINDEFWNSQIEQINITLNKEGEQIIDIVPRVGQQIIRFGTIHNFEKKFKRLRTFYEEAMPSIGWNKYPELSLEYDNQIIGTKQKQ